MGKLSFLGLVVVSLSVMVNAQTPVIGAGGIVNGASFRVPGAPGGGVAPGSFISIFGTNLAASTGAATALPLPFSLNGTSVTVGGIAAALYYVSALQINAQVPWGVAPGSVPVIVTTAGGTSAPVNVTVQTASPGIFTQASNGKGQGSIQNFVSQTSTPLNNPTTAIAPGGVIIIYAAGLGAVNNPPANGAAGNGQTTSNAVTVRVGTFTVSPEFAGLAPGFAGLYQVNVRLPSTLAEGCNIVVQVLVADQVSNSATISSARSGNCTTLPTEFPVAAGASPGFLNLVRTTTQTLTVPPIPIPGFNPIQVSSALSGSFFRYGPEVAGSIPVPLVGGGCIVDFTNFGSPTATRNVTYLDAGALTHTPPTGASQPVPLAATGRYFLGSSAAGGFTIDPGTHTVRGAGGTQVGPFTATINTGMFTGRTDIAGTSISQAAGFTVSWDVCPDPTGTVTIQGVGFPAGLASGLFACTVACSDRSYKVDSTVLRQFPVIAISSVMIRVIYSSSFSRFTATGIDQGYFSHGDVTALSGLTLVP